jgi:spore coat polysaccharide biosynthesis protein SpsF
MKIAAIVQARMGSVRLIGKTLMHINGKTVLERVVERLRMSELLDDIIVSTTVLPLDNPIESLCNDIGCICYRGNPIDVLDRYYKTAVSYNVNLIVRITGDCPCIDPNKVDMTIAYALKQPYIGYYTFGDVRKGLVPDYPDGFDVEVFNSFTLRQAQTHASLSNEREHVGQWMLKNTTYGFMKFNDKLPVKLSIDTKEDLDRVRDIYNHLGDKFTLNDVIKYLKEKEQNVQLQ